MLRINDDKAATSSENIEQFTLSISRSLVKLRMLEPQAEKPGRAFSHCRNFRDFIITLDNLLYLRSEEQQLPQLESSPMNSSPHMRMPLFENHVISAESARLSSLEDQNQQLKRENG